MVFDKKPMEGAYAFEDFMDSCTGGFSSGYNESPYNFDFISIREKYNEKELKDALMDSIKDFLLELGNGFAFVGREYRLMLGEKENFVDMLFFNIPLRCYNVLGNSR